MTCFISGHRHILEQLTGSIMATQGHWLLVIITVLMTLLMHVQTVRLRREYLISYRKPVMVEPSGVTCTEGNITLDKTKMFLGYNGSDITYQCLSTCERRYPLDHSTLLQAVGEGKCFRCMWTLMPVKWPSSWRACVRMHFLKKKSCFDWKFIEVFSKVSNKSTVA